MSRVTGPWIEDVATSSWHMVKFLLQTYWSRGRGDPFFLFGLRSWNRFYQLAATHWMVGIMPGYKVHQQLPTATENVAAKMW